MTTTHRPRFRRLLAMAGVAALGVALLPGAAVAEEHDEPTARGFDRVCPASDSASVEDPADPDDVDGTTHAPAIECALQYGLVQGFEDGSYGPDLAVTRGQMATFVVNWIRTAANAQFEATEDDYFTDVEGTTHADSINALAGVGIVSGRDDGSFGPDDPITRGQMARFVTGAIDVADTLEVDGSLPPEDTTEYFDDVAGTTFEAEIFAIAGVGIVQGVGEGLYAPNAAVTRGQLATFLMSAADYLDRNQRWAPTAIVATYEVALTGEMEVDDSGAAPVYGQGQADATGTATLTIDAFDGEMEVDLDYAEVDGPFDEGPGAHIHIGGIDENGPIVVALATGAELEAAGGSLTTTIAQDIDEFRFADLIENPEGFYVNVHSDAFPAGAIRGQLPTGGQDLLEAEVFEVTLTGDAEVDATGDEPVFGVGEPGATADATIAVDYTAGEIDYSIDLSGVTGPFGDAPGFHIHAGAEDENGGIVAFLADGAAVADAEADGTLSGTFTGASQELLRELIQNPQDYYLNLHSEDYPAGAVRAQLG